MRLVLCLLLIFSAAGCATGPASPGPEIARKTAALFVVAGFDDQVTGVAVASSGRIFVSFPRWGRDPRYSVAELMSDGSRRPYPDAAWNGWGLGSAADPERHFVCVQSVYADRSGYLWILDPASPSFRGVVPGGAKLLKVNLATDAVERVISFGDDVVPKSGYLNDVRVSPDGGTAYLTESGAGALIVVDLGTGRSRRLLSNHPSTKAEPGVVPVIEGRELRGPEGKPPQIHADGIALDGRGEFLYYQALTSRTLYRIRTEHLRNRALSDAELAGHVERVADTGPVDGLEIGENDVLYLTALEENAVKFRRPDGGSGVIARGEEIRWPDSLAIGPGNYLYFTASQINRMPRFNDGVDRHTAPYLLFRIWLAPL